MCVAALTENERESVSVSRLTSAAATLAVQSNRGFATRFAATRKSPIAFPLDMVSSLLPKLVTKRAEGMLMVVQWSGTWSGRVRGY
jgi:hypothetical protein